jgi:hypothetical protein
MRERGGIDPVYATEIPEWYRFGRIEDEAQVFDEMPLRTVLKDARVLLLDEASRVQGTVRRMWRRRAGRTHTVQEELCRVLTSRATTCRAAAYSAWQCFHWACSGRDRVSVQEGRA